MKKSIRSVFLAFVVLTILLSGCAPASTPVSPTFTPTPLPTNTPLPTQTPIPPTATLTPTQTPAPTGTPTPPPNFFASPGTGFTLVNLHPKDGDLPGLLTAEAQKAAALGQLPVVEFFDWENCPPSKDLDASLDTKNELMLQAFDGVYIIRLDVNEWGWDMSKYGFIKTDEDALGVTTPSFYKLDAQGKPNGKVITGASWGMDTPKYMAPPLDEFFHGTK